MSQHDDGVSLQQMLDHANEAVEFVRGSSRGDLESDRKLELALVRLVEIVGEAATRVSESKRRELSQIEWPKVVAMRNRLIHGYDMVDLNILWDTTQSDLPALIEHLEAALGSRE